MPRMIAISKTMGLREISVLTGDRRKIAYCAMEIGILKASTTTLARAIEMERSRLYSMMFRFPVALNWRPRGYVRRITLQQAQARLAFDPMWQRWDDDKL